MKKLLFLLFLTPLFLSAEESPPFEVKDPATTENFRNVYQTIDKMGVSTNDAGHICISGTVFCIDQTYGRILYIPTTNNYSYFLIRTIAGENRPGVIRFSGQSGANDLAIWMPANHSQINLGATDGVTFSTAVVIDDTGEITQPLQPSFLVTNSAGATNVTGNSVVWTVVWGNEVFDQGSDFASNTFTAPVSGRYSFSAQVLVSNLDAVHTIADFDIVTSNRNYTGERANVQTGAIGSYMMVRTSVAEADMDANDTATVLLSVRASGQTVGIAGIANFNIFSGTLAN